jgi:hypothetical protein
MSTDTHKYPEGHCASFVVEAAHRDVGVTESEEGNDKAIR